MSKKRLVVAKLRRPVSVTNLVKISELLKDEYGGEQFIRREGEFFLIEKEAEAIMAAKDNHPPEWKPLSQWLEEQAATCLSPDAQVDITAQEVSCVARQVKELELARSGPYQDSLEELRALTPTPMPFSNLPL